MKNKFEIIGLFRGIDSNTNEFRYGFYFSDVIEGKHYIHLKRDEVFEVKQNPIDFYSNKCAVNGQPIYSGDIIQGFNNDVKWEVEYDVNESCFMVVSKSFPHLHLTKQTLSQFIKHHKNQVFICGNTHSLKSTPNEK